MIRRHPRAMQKETHGRFPFSRMALGRFRFIALTGDLKSLWPKTTRAKRWLPWDRAKWLGRGTLAVGDKTLLSSEFSFECAPFPLWSTYQQAFVDITRTPELDLGPLPPPSKCASLARCPIDREMLFGGGGLTDRSQSPRFWHWHRSSLSGERSLPAAIDKSRSRS